MTADGRFRTLPALMSRQIWPLLTLLFLLSRAVAGDDPLAVAPQPGLVLLRNGQVMSGKITQAGNFYYVTLPGGEIRLPAEQVELACRNLTEGYERKRAGIDPEKLADHLDLAIWCLRQKPLRRGLARNR